MKGEKLLVVVRVDLIDVFNYEIRPVQDWGALYVEVPPGVIPNDYKHMQIEIYRSGDEP